MKKEVKETYRFECGSCVGPDKATGEFLDKETLIIIHSNLILDMTLALE